MVQNRFRGDKTQQFRFVDEGSGYYSLRPIADESLRVDISNASNSDGAEVKLFVNNPAYGSQKFKIEYRGNNMVTLRPYLSSTRVLEVRNSSMDEDAPVQLYTYNSNVATMHWFLEEATTPGIETGETYYIRNKATNKYLDVMGGNITTNGARVGNYSFNGNANQKWVVTRNNNGTYTLKTAYDNNFVLDVNGNTVDIWRNGYPTDQQFTIVRDSANNNGTYFMIIKGKYVTASGESVFLQDLSLIAPSAWAFERVKKRDATIISHSSDTPWFPGNAANNTHKTLCANFGYPSYAFDNSRDSTQALSYLKTDDIWVHSQHGGIDSMEFRRTGYPHTYIMGHNHIRSSSNNSLNNVRCFISLGCSVGGGEDDKNMLYSVYQKGASFALGWTNITYTPTAMHWYESFLRQCNRGSNIYDAMQTADREVSNVSIGRRVYYGDSGQHLNR